MKYLVRLYMFSVFALWLTAEVIPGFTISEPVTTMLGAGLVLSFLMLIVRPMLRILFIPVNILTFGLFSWIINVFMIYLLTLIVPEVDIVPWVFPGVNTMGFVIPGIDVSYYGSLVISSIVITLISNLLHQVSES